MHSSQNARLPLRYIIAATFAAVTLAAVAGCALAPMLRDPDLQERGTHSSAQSPVIEESEARSPTLTSAESERPESASGGAVLPSPEEPVRPDAVDLDGPEGAIATARHYLAVHDYAFFSGNPIPLWELAARECESCRASSDEVYKLHGKGEYAIFGEAVPQSEPVIEEHEKIDGAWVVEFDEVTGGVQRLDKFGDVIGERRAGADRTTWVTVSYQDDRWRVLDLGYIEVD